MYFPECFDECSDEIISMNYNGIIKPYTKLYHIESIFSIYLCQKIDFYYSSRLLTYANWRKTTSLLSEPQLITPRKLYSCILTWHTYTYFSLIIFIFKARRIDNKLHQKTIKHSLRIKGFNFKDANEELKRM